MSIDAPIENVVAQLLEASLTGKSIQHYCQGQQYAFIIIGDRVKATSKLVFRHQYDPDASLIPVTITLHEAISIVKKYWNRRLPNEQNY